MSLDVLITGRLVKAAQERKSANGNTFALAQVSVPTEGDESLLASCIAFSRTAVEALLALDKGDAVALAGKAKLNNWIGVDGQTKTGLNVTVEQLLTAYHVQRKRTAVKGDSHQDDQALPPRKPRAASTRERHTAPATTRTIGEMSDDIPF